MHNLQWFARDYSFILIKYRCTSFHCLNVYNILGRLFHECFLAQLRTKCSWWVFVVIILLVNLISRLSSNISYVCSITMSPDQICEMYSQTLSERLSWWYLGLVRIYVMSRENKAKSKGNFVNTLELLTWPQKEFFALSTWLAYPMRAMQSHHCHLVRSPEPSLTFSFKRHLLLNQYTNFNLTSHEYSFGRLPSTCSEI